jgi:hypothetical protein
VVGGVADGLRSGVQQEPFAVADGAVTDGPNGQVGAVGCLGGDGFQGRTQGGGADVGGAQEPAQFVLCAAGVLARVLQVVRARDGGQVLQDGVVEPGGALRAFGLAGRLGLGGGQVGLQAVAFD